LASNVLLLLRHFRSLFDLDSFVIIFAQGRVAGKLELTSCVEGIESKDSQLKWMGSLRTWRHIVDGVED
jgi:hypothetical protein